MSRILHTVRLTSRRHYGSKAPPAALGEILRVLPVAVGRSIRMSFAGRSTIRGRRPDWLKAASDIRLAGYGGNDDTLLYFEAPQFGEAAEELYQQTEFWPSKPPPEDTGFDLLGDVLADVRAQAEDSQRFDRALLQGLIGFRTGLSAGFDGIYFTGHRYAEQQPAEVTWRTLEQARHLYEETPPSQRVRVAGRLDMIWQSRQCFRLILDDGQEIPGVLVKGDIAAANARFGQRVLVHGRAVYRPSGHLLRLDAEYLEAGTNEPAIWSRIPPARARKLDLTRLRQPQGPRSGVAAIMGRWPGDETDEEIQRALEELS